ncbi:MAG: twin transmembrane helix small protein [Limnobacter sp.]|nr:twin transmembrane helix small protein [Limnobacter sp.]
MKIVVGILFVIILASLASAFLFLMKDKSQTNRTVKALTVRIGLSVGLFLLILFSWHMGWIETTGIR